VKSLLHGGQGDQYSFRGLKQAQSIQNMHTMKSGKDLVLFNDKHLPLARMEQERLF